eukprot:scaffold126_cov315-Pavlova_lutheri.AAC.43
MSWDLLTSWAHVHLINLSNKNAFSRPIVLLESPGATCSHRHDGPVFVETNRGHGNWMPFRLQEFLSLQPIPDGEASICSSCDEGAVVAWMMGHGLHRMHYDFSAFVLAVALEGVLFGLDVFRRIHKLYRHAAIHGRHDEATRVLGDADGSCLRPEGRFSSLPRFVVLSEIEDGHLSPCTSDHQHVFFRVHGVHFVIELGSPDGHLLFRFPRVPEQDVFVPSAGDEQVPPLGGSDAPRSRVVHAEQASICADHVVAPHRSVRTHAGHLFRISLHEAASQPGCFVHCHSFGQAPCVAHRESSVPERGRHPSTCHAYFGHAHASFQSFHVGSKRRFDAFLVRHRHRFLPLVHATVGRGRGRERERREGGQPIRIPPLPPLPLPCFSSTPRGGGGKGTLGGTGTWKVAPPGPPVPFRGRRGQGPRRTSPVPPPPWRIFARGDGSIRPCTRALCKGR